MGLAVTELDLRDFRSYESCRLSGLGRLTLLVGPNAVGKTNVIEALQLCTAISSFRNPKPAHLVRMGASSAWAKVTLEDEFRHLELELRVSDEGKGYLLNGKKRTGASCKGLLPAVLFCPDDLDLVKGSSSVRRHQLDSLGSQVSSGYRAVLRDYEKIVQQKNRYLKEQASWDFLVAINEVLARVGAQLFILRARLVGELAPYVTENYAEIASGRDVVTLALVPSWEQDSDPRPVDEFRLERNQVEALILEALSRRQFEERERRRCLVGPHADKIMFFLEGGDASVFASQGQQRSIVLALKMAEVMLVRDRLGQTPVLLLDDVMSELDSDRRSAFMSGIPFGVQTFVTATNLGYFEKELIADADVVSLNTEDGSRLLRFKWDGRRTKGR